MRNVITSIVEIDKNGAKYIFKEKSNYEDEEAGNSVRSIKN